MSLGSFTTRWVSLGTLSVMAAMAGASSSLAQSQGSGGCPAVDPGAEIEVTANESEFLQQQHMVVLTGAVDVLQGAVRLQADKVIIFYSEPEGENTNTSQSETSDDRQTGLAGTITRLDALGAVNVTCGSERAKGQTATYDIMARAIDLAGDVTLVREGNVLKGEKLHINLDTGRSRIVGTTNGADESGERVRAIFRTPNTEDNASDDENSGN